jgi:hypothetical protein
MKKFVFLYSGGTAPSSPAEGEKVMKAWNDWFASQGASVDIAGEAFASSKTVSAQAVKDGADGNISNGFSVFKAVDIAAATKIARSCPIVADGGKVHVFEVMEM